MRLPFTSRARRTAAAAALVLIAAGTTGPAAADDVPTGTLSLTFAYDSGAPVTALASFVDAAGHGTTQELATSTYSKALPGGTTYGAVLVGGWGGLTCVRVTPCSWLAIQGDPMSGVPTPDAPLLAEDGTATLAGTVATPKLSGAGAVGSPLTITVPPGLIDLANVFTLGNGGTVEPGVTWLRNGGAITGASGLTYVPTSADAGATISAVVAYPTALTRAWSASFPALVPGPLTTSGIAVRAPAPASPKPTLKTPRISLSVPARFKQGKRPKAYVTVKYGARAVRGIVKLQIGKRRAQRATLRSGLATFVLPNLKPGRFVVRATYTGSVDYRSVAQAKKVVVRATKHGR